MSIEFYYVAVVVTLIFSAARITRLLVVDDFPPIKYLRDKTPEDSDWSLLAYCGYCMSWWVGVVLFVWAHLAGVFDGSAQPAWSSQAWWWGVNGAFAFAYLAAMVVARDGDS